MKSVFKYLLIVSVFVCSVSESVGKAWNAGVYSSMKGFGISLETASPDGSAYNNFSLYADCYGVLNGRSETPGVLFRYSRNRILYSVENNEAGVMIYIGPGVSFGYIHDYERGLEQPLSHNFGATLALCGSAGIRFHFTRGVCFDLGWTVQAGVHIRSDEYLMSYDLSWYQNGILQAWTPSLSIMYSF